MAAAREVQDALKASCSEMYLQEGMVREHAQETTEVNTRHWASIRDQRTDNAEVSAENVSAAIALEGQSEAPFSSIRSTVVYEICSLRQWYRMKRSDVATRRPKMLPGSPPIP